MPSTLHGRTPTRFSLDELMVALANGAAEANPSTAQPNHTSRGPSDPSQRHHGLPMRDTVGAPHSNNPWGWHSACNQRVGDGYGPGSSAYQVGKPAFADDADELLDIIPAPVASDFDSHDPSGDSSLGDGGYGHGMLPPGDPGGECSAGPPPSSSWSGSSPTVGCPGMLADIHMRLLDFLAWDRTRGLRCGREGKQEAYWRNLLPSVNRFGGAAGGGGAGGAGGANGEAAAGVAADEEEFGGAPETTLPGLRDSRELVQASPHGFPELLRLVAIHREGVLRRVETRRMAAARGFAGLGFRREGARGRDARVLQARVLDPLGEVMRILRHVIRSEEAKPFVDVPSDEDVEPEAEAGGLAEDGVGVDGGSDGNGEGGGDGASASASAGADGQGVKKEARPGVKRPLDLGTILKRAENGWYDLEPGAEVIG